MIHYVCSFVVSREKGREDAPLRCRVRWSDSAHIVSVNVGYRVDPSKWDSRTQRCLPNSFHSRHHTPASVINREIDHLRDVTEKVFASFASPPMEDEVRTAIRQQLGKEERKDVTVSQAFLEFKRDGLSRLAWGEATPEKFKALENHLKKWRDPVRWTDFDTNGLTSFLLHLRDEEELRNSTILKQLSFLKWFLRWCAERGYLTCRDFETFAPKFKTTQKRVIFLEWDELMKVWEFQPIDGEEHLIKVRDIFCFCAFTGLRYSDAMGLRWSDVEDNCIRITTQKTQDSLTIDLNKWSKEILGRYVDVAVSGDFVFPRIANQKMNEHVKTLCALCFIDSPTRVTWYQGNKRIDQILPKYKLISTHAARRTFICNALTMGIAPTVVMQWTGHSSYAAMRPYIDIADRAKADAMSLFDAKNKD